MPSIKMHSQNGEDIYFKLQEATNLSESIIKKYINSKDISKKVLEIYRLAEESRKLGNDEEAFKRFMHFLQLVKALGMKHSDDKKYMKAMYGKQMENAVINLEKLKQSLIAKYNEKEKREALERAKKAEVKSKESIPKSAPSNLEIATKNNQKSITSKQLYSELGESLLLLDVRLEKDFNESHILHDFIINIPPSRLKSSITANKLEIELAPSAREVWRRRNSFKFIVLLDWFSTENDLKPPNPLFYLYDAINTWDPNVVYQNKAVILRGGYDDWLDYYPTRTTKANVLRPENSSPLIQLDEIQYPNPDDFIPLSKQMVIKPKTTPLIPDRNKKPLLNNTKVDVNLDSGYNNEIKPETGMPKGDQENKINEDASSVIKKPGVNNVEKNLELTLNQKLKISKDAEPIKADNLSKDQLPQLNNVTTMKPGTFSADTPSEAPSEAPSGNPSLKRSLSSPNINQLKEEGGGGAASSPIIDRSCKPLPLRQIEPSNVRDLRDSDPVHGKVIRGLTGLKNLRNTCYMNSILQCLSNTKDLSEYFLKYDFQKNTRSKTEGNIAEEFRTVILKLWAGEYKSFACKSLKNRIGHYRNTFSGYDQQDSHEFLTILIDWLHEDLKKPVLDVRLAGATEENGERAWGEFKKNNSSLIQELFYGQQKSVVTCLQCRERSITFEPFSNLSLPLPSSKDSCTLNECFDLYLQSEIIFGWECPKCKAAQRAEKKLDITRLPPTLVIHFKRFTSDGWCRKQQTYVDFPVNVLDMSKYLAGAEHRNIVFSLYAISNHYGTMDSGHYTAYCKSAAKKWYKFDDQEVCELSPEHVKSSAAYIVFYSKINNT